jgi:hypothetical protein
MAAAMLAQNSEPTGTTADLVPQEEDDGGTEMRILEQKAAKQQAKAAQQGKKITHKIIKIPENYFPTHLKLERKIIFCHKIILSSRLVKGMGFAWGFHPFFRRFEQNIGENGDRKSGRGCITLQACSRVAIILGQPHQNP